MNVKQSYLNTSVLKRTVEPSVSRSTLWDQKKGPLKRGAGFVQVLENLKVLEFCCGIFQDRKDLEKGYWSWKSGNLFNSINKYKMYDRK